MISGHKRDIRKTLLIILALFVAFVLIGVLFHFILKIFFHDEGGFNVHYDTSDYVSITNKLPISDTLGKKLDVNDKDSAGVVSEFIIFNKHDISKEFDIYLKKSDIEGKEIGGDYIRLYLTDEDDKIVFTDVVSYNDLKYMSDQPSDKVLYHGSINSNSNKKYCLRVWLSDSYPFSIGNKEEFAFQVSVKVW